MLTEYLFDTPWWFPTVLVIVGSFLFVTANARQDVKLRSTGLACALLGVFIAAVSFLVDTPVEKAVKQSKALVAAVAARDWPAVESILAPDASLKVNSLPVYADRAKLLAGAGAAVERFGLKSAGVTSATATREDALIRVRLKVYSVQTTTMDRPVPSDWEFDFEDTPADGLRLVEIINESIAGQVGEGARQQFPR